jgi:restriction system protein
MPRWNPEMPWNPGTAVEISPQEYERQVVAWLRAAGATLEQFEVKHLHKIGGEGGEYEFDAVAELSLLQGAKIVLLVECKRYSKPVEREKVMALWAKLQDVKAHKAMIFATCGFQSGALEYAQTYGIATIAFLPGKFLYMTKSMENSEPEPPPWANLPPYAGIFMRKVDGAINCSTIDSQHIEPLSEWIQQ